MSKTMTILAATLVGLLAVAAAGVGAYATGQDSRMSDQQVTMKVRVATEAAEAGPKHARTGCWTTRPISTRRNCAKRASRRASAATA